MADAVEERKAAQPDADVFIGPRAPEGAGRVSSEERGPGVRRGGPGNGEIPAASRPGERAAQPGLSSTNEPPRQPPIPPPARPNAQGGGMNGMGWWREALKAVGPGFSLALIFMVGAYFYLDRRDDRTHERDLLLLKQQNEERADYRKILQDQQNRHATTQNEQRKDHTAQTDKMLTLIITKIIDAIDEYEKATRESNELIRQAIQTQQKITPNITMIREATAQMQERQKALPELVNRLIDALTAYPETRPAGRQRAQPTLPTGP